MSRRMNHAKIGVQKRIAYEAHPSNSDYSIRVRSKWLAIPFGEHAGLTMPEIAIYFPWYLNWLVSKSILKECNDFQRTLASQARIALYRVKRILPPVPRKGKRFAIIENRNGVFERFAIVGDDSTIKPGLAKGSKVVKRTRELDVMIPSTLSNPKEGYARMLGYLLETFFPHCGGQPGAIACEQFIDEDGHFNI